MTTVPSARAARAALADDAPAIRWTNLIWVGLALGVMVAAILVEDLYFLNFVHVLAGLLWTGVDLFMGFVVGPILRRVEPPVRRAIALRLMPRTLFIMPTLAIVAPTTGWYLAEMTGFAGLGWPEYGWMVAALAITGVLGVLGVGVLLPTNLIVFLELRKRVPDAGRISRLMRCYVFVVAVQGAMQIGIVAVMAKFATGL